MFPLRACESELQTGHGLQWRQVHPTQVSDGVVARDGFRGTDAAPAEVSTVQSALRTAEEAYDQHRAAGYKTAGTWAVTIQEVLDARCRVIADDGCDDVETPGHSFVDMRDLTKAEQRVARVALAAIATERGLQHPV